MNEYEAHALRLQQIAAVLPGLLRPPASGLACLYVGATPWRFQMGPELADAGYSTTLLEVDKDNAYFYQGHPLLPGGVIHSDVRTLDTAQSWDTVVWWHGPEHIAPEDLSATLARLEGYADRLVVLAAPWGENWQPPVEGNAHQEHKAHLQPDDFTALGYQAVTLGVQGDMSTWPHILAWKYTAQEQLTVYTAIFGAYDQLRPAPWPGRYVCFSDQPIAQIGWNNVVVPRRFNNPRQDARMYKALAHRFLPDAGMSLWLDGNIELLRPPAELGLLLTGADIALPVHPTSATLAAEAAFVVQLGKADKQAVARQMADYRMPTLPVGATGFLLRRHTPAIWRLNEMWWAEQNVHTLRDQLSLPYCLYDMGIQARLLDLDIYGNDMFLVHAHRGNGHD